MIEILPATGNGLVATKAIGKQTVDDYELLLPVLNQALERKDKIDWYYEMDELEGWKPKALWEDEKFDLKHANDFRKIAMVGDKKWEEWMTKLMKPFTSAEIRYFDLEEKKEAMNWIQS